ncbi:MAG: hypothetical protein EPN36_16250 [Rhodanobacteraceae bacterium]|nr:MAG: hypothetical protein EPN36_16250 [Rhodanobacteraceae bacterium]
MIDPGEALGTSAQVAVTLAGFAGVVVVFGSRAVHEWSDVNKFRLRLLLTFSTLPLVFSMVGMLLMATTMPPAAVWRWCSAISVVLQLCVVSRLWKIFTAFPASELKATGASRLIFYGGAAAGTAVTILQIANVWVLATFWPFFMAIVFAILASTLQFMRLILNRPEWA